MNIPARARLPSCLTTFLAFIGYALLFGAMTAPAWSAGERELLGNAQAIPLAASADPLVRQTLGDLQRKLTQQASIRVIVGTRVPFAAEGRLQPDLVAQQRREIAASHAALLSKIPSLAQRPEQVKRFKTIPFLALEVTLAELQQLMALPEVTSIEEDRLAKPTLGESVPLIGGPAAWASGYSGSGRTVAILDTGVDKNHPFLTGKVVSEACYSTSNISYASSSVCPGGVSASTAAGSALPYAGVCPAGECDHGTHVAGITAGGNSLSSTHGVAKDASLIAVQVFSKFVGATNCGTGVASCALSWGSDQILGLERVYALRSSYPAIDAVNMSLGGGSYSSQATCDYASASTKAAIDNLRSVNIATVISSGNSGSTASMGSPGCISTAISVGATWDSAYPTGISCASGSTDHGGVDKVACFSSSAFFLNLLAPGIWITSSVPGTGYATWAGTSMAAPHVAGAWALLKQKSPTATVSDVFSALSATGVAVLDTRNGITKPRINLPAALAALGSSVNYPLTVLRNGSGSGTVLSGPGGIDCGATCSASFADGSVVTLVASGSGSGTGTFTGWSGACSGTGNCTVTMTAAKNVTASFVAGTSIAPLSLTALTGVTGTQAYYSVAVPAGARNLVIQTSGGTGDVDLYVKVGAQPRSTTFDCGSWTDGNAESCTFATPQTATYDIMLDAYIGYTGVSLSARYTMPDAPVACRLTAAPARVKAGQSSTLTASCSPPYTWTGGTCVGQTAATCIVTPATTTTYRVIGTNNVGSSQSASATVTIRSVDLSPILMLLLD